MDKNGHLNSANFRLTISYKKVIMALFQWICHCSIDVIDQEEDKSKFTFLNCQARHEFSSRKRS